MKKTEGKKLKLTTLGFTLVELLAVIVILAVILVIAVPQIMNVIKDSKKGTLESTTKVIASSAEKEYINKKALGLEVGTIKCSDVVKMNSEDYGNCKVTFDDNGVATVVLNGKVGGKFNNLACSDTKDNITCTEGEIATSRKCTTTNASDTTLVDEQYTYTYDESTGWSVILTDKESTDPVTTELCGTINDKPIVSMAEMFSHSKATSIDLSSFDTSKVVNMYRMFIHSAATSLDVSGFDTSSATNMQGMFFGSKATNLDLSNFDTSKVTDMSHMFHVNNATEIKGLDKFNTSNVIYMNDMFYGSDITSLDLSSFDTSKVTSMNSMFANSEITEIKGLDKFNTSKVTNMAAMFTGSKIQNLDLSNFDTSNVTNMTMMFENSQTTKINVLSFNTSKVKNMTLMFSDSKIEALDLSSFDTSSVTDMQAMFSGSKATTGYARTQKDADNFNASSGKPDALTFVVK